MSDSPSVPPPYAPLSLTPVVCNPIGIVHSCFSQKFGVPRQPQLATSAQGWIEIAPHFAYPEAFRGLDGFSHIWVHFVFHQTQHEGWRPTIRPPRLEGKKRFGVFATRSTHRPNPLGLSVVQLNQIEICPSTSSKPASIRLHIQGLDLVDQTPVLDIKPYLPYADSLPHASSGFAPLPNINQWPVYFEDEPLQEIQNYEEQTQRPLKELTIQVLAQDPRPPYLKKTTFRRQGIVLWDVNIVWESRGDAFWVYALEFNQSDVHRTVRGYP
jgi:tRNA-Thr(GGU) m(6)t(6)A37 methyltransferase TsaA